MTMRTALVTAAPHSGSCAGLAHQTNAVRRAVGTARGHFDPNRGRCDLTADRDIPVVSGVRFTREIDARGTGL